MAQDFLEIYPITPNAEDSGARFILEWQTVAINEGAGTTYIQWKLSSTWDDSSISQLYYDYMRLRVSVISGNATVSNKNLYSYLGASGVKEIDKDTNLLEGTFYLTHEDEEEIEILFKFEADVLSDRDTDYYWQWQMDDAITVIEPMYKGLSIVPIGGQHADYNGWTDETDAPIIYSTNALLDVDEIVSINATIVAVDDGRQLCTWHDIPIPDNNGEEIEATMIFGDLDKEIMYAGMQNVNKATVEVLAVIELIDGSTRESISNFDIRLNIVDAYPEIHPTVRDVNPKTVALTGDENKIVRYKSNAEFNFNADIKKGAVLDFCYVDNGSKQIQTETGVFEGAESNEFYFSLHDSRGLRDEELLKKDVVEYFLPTCRQKVTIALTAESVVRAEIEIKGEFFNASFGAANNQMVLQIRYSREDGTMSDWATIPDIIAPEISGNEYTASFNLTGFDSKSAYDFQSRVIDKLSTVETPVYTARLTPVFDWSENDFRVHVPVEMRDGLAITGILSATGDANIGGSLTIQDNPLVDYVIEEGTEAMGSNGTWYWRKWNSGRAECYGCRNFGVTSVTTAYGGLFRSETFTQSLPSGLFTAIPDVIDISLRQATTYGGWIVRHEETKPTKSDAGSFIIVRPASANIGAAHVSFNVIGRWKS